MDGLDCSDSDPCTILDHCASGVCLGDPNDCDDGLDCTDDLCQADTGECQSPLKAGWCNIKDQCQQEGNRPPGPDEDCNICAPDSSTTEWTPYHEGQGCDDLSDCTAQSICLQGSCTSNDVPCDDGNVCTQDICLPDKTCDHPPVVELTSCTDDLLCTIDDQCEVGVCLGAPVDCGATECTPALCDDDTGECVPEPEADGTACDDEDPCSIDDGCVAGVCEGEAKDCSALTGGNSCKLAFCDPKSDGEPGQCTVELKGEGAYCEDGLFCTVGEVCDAAGACLGGNPKSCAGQFGQCNIGACHELTNQCVAIAKEAGTPCNADDDGCTLDDSCNGGLCIPGDPPNCSQDVPPCYETACESQGPTNYLCSKAPALQGAPCDDGKFCTIDESCDGSGACHNGQPRDCQAELSQCEVGACNEFTNSCKTSAAPVGTPCDDENECTMEEACSNGVCSGGTDACNERKLNGPPASIPLGGPTDIAHLGYGTTVSVWGWHPVTATVVDGELSKIVPGIQLETGPQCEIPVGNWETTSKCSDNGFPELHGRAVAARPDGHWVVTEMNRCGVATRSGAFSYAITDMGNDEGTFTAYDGKLDLAAPWSAADLPYLWQDDTGTWTGGQWQPIVEKSCGVWLDHLSLVPPDKGSVGAIAFADGSFGLLSDSGLAYYRAVSNNYVPGQLIELEGMHAPQACVIPTNVAAIVYDDGAGTVYGMFHDKNGNALGDSFAISETLEGKQERPYCESLPDGRFVVVFNTGFDDGPADVYARVFKPNGSPQTDAVKVNKATIGLQQAVGKPAFFDDGTIVVAWEDEEGDVSGYGVKARVFDDTLTPITGELQLNNRVSGDQRWPVVQEAADGWLAVWTEALGGGLYDVYFRKYDSEGAPQQGAPERLVAHAKSGDQRHGAIAALPDGDFAVAWEEEGLDGPDSGIGLRFFDPLGVPTSGKLQVNEHEAGPQHEPTVTYDTSSDRLLVVWTSTGQEIMDDVYARVLDGSGQPVSGEFLVNGATSDVQYEPAVDSCGGGTFAVAWTGYTSLLDGNDVFLRLFDNNGSALGPEARVNVDPADDQEQPTVISYCDDAGMGILTGWTQTSLGGDVGVYLRLFDLAGNPLTGDVLLADQGNPEQVALARSDDGEMIACWKSAAALRCRRVDGELNLADSSFEVETDGSPSHPRMVFRAADRFWLAYDRTDADAGGLAVVRADLDLTGEEKSSRVLVNWHEKDDQSVPFMARLAADDVAIGWTGGDKDDAGVSLFFRVLD